MGQLLGNYMTIKKDTLELKYLSELSDLDPTHETVKEIVNMFLDMVPQHLNSLKAAMNAGEYKKVQKVAHFLKSSAGNLGAMNFFTLCNQLENLTDWNPPSTANELIAALDNEFVQVHAALNQELQKMTSLPKGT